MKEVSLEGEKKQKLDEKGSISFKMKKNMSLYKLKALMLKIMKIGQRR